MRSSKSILYLSSCTVVFRFARITYNLVDFLRYRPCLILLAHLHNNLSPSSRTEISGLRLCNTLTMTSPNITSGNIENGNAVHSGFILAANA